MLRFTCFLLVCSITLLAKVAKSDDLVRLNHNDPNLVVDLGVGLWAWPLPMDWDGDGDLDLVVSCPDKPYNGTYLFKNPGKGKKGDTNPVFEPGIRVSRGHHNAQVSYVDGKPVVTLPGLVFPDFQESGYDSQPEKLPLPAGFHKPQGVNGKKIRANQWRFADYDGDGADDLIVGIGDWSDYGWDDAYNEKGEWTHGPLRGFVYWAKNTGTDDDPKYDDPVKIQAAGEPVDVFGMPSPNLADFDGDGDLDLLCGEFRDGFTYFRNSGSAKEPKFDKGVQLPVRMELCMITPTAVDWDGDGDQDLIVGDEDGRVAWLEHTGEVKEGVPVFREPVYFKQRAADLKFGALATPVGVDWDGDGDDDIVAGNTAGQIGFFENLGKGKDGDVRWAAPKLLDAGGETICIQAGYNGSIQGPAETKWGYTTFTVADWDGDGLLDIVANSIWGKVILYRNTGAKGDPKLQAAQPVEVEWSGDPPKPAWFWWNPEGKELVTQWRTTPVATDWDGDDLVDLVMLDHEGFLCLFRREKRGDALVLLPPRRLFVDEKGEAIQLNKKWAGGSGRRKLCVVDWDGDGKLDILANSENAEFWRNMGERDGKVVLKNLGNIAERKVSGHTSSPSVIDLNSDGVPELLVGAEDGRMYHLRERPDLSLDEKSIGGLKVESRGVTFAKLDNGGVAFSNRGYTWFDVPEPLQGWTYTKTAGGENPVIAVHADKDTKVFFATAPSQKGGDLDGWKKTGHSFAYTDGGKTRLQVYERNLGEGETVDVPQGSWTGGILLVPAAPPAQSSASAPKPRPVSQPGGPNVLFIAVDDLRVELGCYGNTPVLSPNIDKLAKEGTLFERAYCQQAVCNPSRASLLTGLRPESLGIWDLPTHFRKRVPDILTLPQLFKENGYHAEDIGKIFHNWRQGDYRGDPVSWSVPEVMHYARHGDDVAQLAEGQEVPPNTSKVPRTERRDVPDEAYFDGRIAARAVKRLREIKDAPFFLAVGFWKPHAPFNAPQKYWDLYDFEKIGTAANPGPPANVPEIALHDGREINRGFDGKPITDTQARTLRHGYYAATSYLDAQVGKVIDELNRLGLREKTIVVLWSDHGFHLGENSLWAKTSNFELDARVPMIISAPGFENGQRSKSLVELLDLYPTLTDLCGLDAPAHLEGKSLRPILENPNSSVKQQAYTWHPRPAYPAAGKLPDVMGFSMRTDRYRYTEWRRHPRGEIVARELYDHGADPSETNNVAAEPANASAVEELGRTMVAHLESHPQVATNNGVRESSPSPAPPPRPDPNPKLPALAKPGEGALISADLIYPLDDKPTPQCHASTIVQAKDGHFVAAWFGGTREKNDDVGIWVSHLEDGKWSKPVNVAQGDEDEDKLYPCWNPVLFQPREGPMMLFYKVGPSPREWWGVMMTSDDGGKTWKGRRRLGDPHPETGPLAGPIKNKPVQLEDGAIVCPTSSEHDGWRVHFEVTRDLGKTWEVIGPINDGKEFGAIQPSILFHKDGKMQIMCRSQQGVVTQSWSEDGGKTWSKMAGSALPNPSAGTDAVTLSDGRQLIVYNHTTRISGNRGILNVAVSEDGHEWTPVLTLEKELLNEFSYPAVIQAADGKVHITYTYKRRSVKHVVLDPGKL